MKIFTITSTIFLLLLAGCVSTTDLRSTESESYSTLYGGTAAKYQGMTEVMRVDGVKLGRTEKVIKLDPGIHEIEVVWSTGHGDPTQDFPGIKKVWICGYGCGYLFESERPYRIKFSAQAGYSYLVSSEGIPAQTAGSTKLPEQLCINEFPESSVEYRMSGGGFVTVQHPTGPRVACSQ